MKIGNHYLATTRRYTWNSEGEDELRIKKRRNICASGSLELEQSQGEPLTFFVFHSYISFINFDT